MILLSLLVFCQRRTFVHVKIKGVLIDYFANQPIMAELQLQTDNPSLFNKSGVLKKIETKNDGSFDLKSRAIWKKEYYLGFIAKDSSISGFVFGGKIENNSTVELGTIYPEHRFNCLLTLNSISSNTLHISNYSNNYIYYPGTNKTITHSTFYSKDVFESQNHNYIINYSIDSAFASYYRSLKIPIINNSNLTATLNF